MGLLSTNYGTGKDRMMADQRERLTIYTLAWRDDRAVGAAEDKTREDGNATIYCRAFLDDREIRCTVAATPRYSSEFTTVLLELAPASVKIIECDAAEWEALG